MAFPVPTEEEVNQSIRALRNIANDPKQPIKPTEATNIRQQILRQVH